MTAEDRVIDSARAKASRLAAPPREAYERVAWGFGGAVAWIEVLAVSLARRSLTRSEEEDLAAAIAFVLNASSTEGEGLIRTLRGGTWAES